MGLRGLWGSVCMKVEVWYFSKVFSDEGVIMLSSFSGLEGRGSFTERKVAVVRFTIGCRS